MINDKTTGEGLEPRPMKMSLNVKQTSSFFWLRKIRGVNINKCCAGCFISDKESQLYRMTHYKPVPIVFEMDIEPAEKYVAYYLCGLSRGMVHANNTHVAFVYAPGEVLHRETEQMKVEISNARWIDFESYVPNPPGEFTEEQRKCRNWIFANFIKDRMLKSIINSEFGGEES